MKMSDAFNLPVVHGSIVLMSNDAYDNDDTEVVIACREDDWLI